MASMNGRVKQIRDADPSKEFRAPGLATVTATGQSAAIALDKLFNLAGGGAVWDNGELPWNDVCAAIVVQSLDLTTGDETYNLTLEVSADAAFTVPVQVAGMTVNAVGYYELEFDADTVKSRLPAAAYVRLKWTLAGTTPILGFYSWAFTDH